jgi:VWFA-related protein
VRAAASLLVALLLHSQETAATPPRFRDEVRVDRIVLEVRVLDRSSRQVKDLAAGDFRVRIDGQPAAVESAEWISAAAGGEAGPAPLPLHQTGGPPMPPGRLLVFLFQKDLQSPRIGGLLRMIHEAAEFLDRLGPDDRIAVASFDSHLKLWLDFTSERAALEEAIRHAVLFARPRPVIAGRPPSLVTAFDRSAARGAVSPEGGIGVLAEAMRPIPGPKSLVLFGWGLGQLAMPYVRMHRDYAAARRALAAARVTVFALDITDADFHTLEVGLMKVAEDTGGFYVKTHLFPATAMSRLEEALSGYFELVVEGPAETGPRLVEVETTDRRHTVLTRSYLH